MYPNMPLCSRGLLKAIRVFLLSLVLLAAQLSHTILGVQASDLVLSSGNASIELGQIGSDEFKTTETLPAGNQQEQLYLPLFTNQPKLATRMGYGITYPRAGSPDDILTFANSAQLKAGWYLNWGVFSNTPNPGGIEFAQMIRVHQVLSCTDDNGNPRRRYAFRDECPYAQPTNATSSYQYWPSQSQIEAVAAARPGSIWLVGNEIEREDWSPNCSTWRDMTTEERADCTHNGQDEIIPETYAMAYHEIYNLIKDVDPTAQVAIGGVIQVTPLRIQYLTAIYDSYLELYGEPIPVDVWNIHAFVFTEHIQGGAGIPVGITPETAGMYQGAPWLHIDFSLVADQIYAMRQWMKDHGQQEKPLIISEYGIVYDNATMRLDENDPTPVINFLIESSTFFLNTKDCTLGYTSDDCRLVQRWNWFSLEGRTAAANPHARLLDPQTGELTPLGQAWRSFVQENHADLYME